MSKRKLWSYGCSYSHEWAETKGWAKTLAKNLDLELIDDDGTNEDATWRHFAGKGFSYYRDEIIKDIPKWGDDDIIIIEESVRLRSYSPYFKKEEYDSLLAQYMVEYYESDPNNFIKGYEFPDDYSHNLLVTRNMISWLMFRDFIRMLLTFRRKNIFVWQYEGRYLEWFWAEPRYNKNLPGYYEGRKQPFISKEYPIHNWDEWIDFLGNSKLTFPNDTDCYTEWMTTDDKIWVNVETLDDHQSQYGQDVMAEYFTKQIKERMI